MVGVTLGLAMLGIAAALLLLGRPREDVRPFMKSPLVFAVYPVTILVFIAMGTLSIVMNI